MINFFQKMYRNQSNVIQFKTFFELNLTNYHYIKAAIDV